MSILIDNEEYNTENDESDDNKSHELDKLHYVINELLTYCKHNHLPIFDNHLTFINFKKLLIPDL